MLHVTGGSVASGRGARLAVHQRVLTRRWVFRMIRASSRRCGDDRNAHTCNPPAFKITPSPAPGRRWCRPEPPGAGAEDPRSSEVSRRPTAGGGLLLGVKPPAAG